MLLSLITSIFIFSSIFTLSLQQENGPFSCQGNHTIEKLADLSQKYWYPNNFGHNPPLFKENQQCYFNIVVPKGYYAVVSISVVILQDGDLEVVDYLGVSESYKIINATKYYPVHPGAQLYLTLKKTQGRFGFAVRWFALPDEFSPNNVAVSKSSPDPVLYGENLGNPNVFTADTRVSLVPFPAYYDQDMEYMRSIVAFDGPDWSSPPLGNLYNIYYSKKQCISTGNKMTVYTLHSIPNPGSEMYMVQDYSNTKHISTYQGSFCKPDKDCTVKMTSDKNGGTAAISTYRDFEYLTSFITDDDAQLDVYIGGILADKSNLIASYNSSKPDLPQQFMGTVRTYVVSNGSAWLDLSGKSRNFQDGFDGRKGFLCSRFYLSQNASNSQDSTYWINGKSFGLDNVFNYKINIRSADLPNNSTLKILIDNGAKGTVEKIFNNSNPPILNQEFTGKGFDLKVTYKTYGQRSKGFYLDYEMEKSSNSRNIFSSLIKSTVNFVKNF